MRKINKVVIVGSSPVRTAAAWFITLIVIFLFLLPATLKYFIEESSVYYVRKAKYEKFLILQEYDIFKTKYKQLMYEKTGKVIEFRERFKNPPFNTKPLFENRTFATETNFLDMIYKNGNQVTPEKKKKGK